MFANPLIEALGFNAEPVQESLAPAQEPRAENKAGKVKAEKQSLLAKLPKCWNGKELMTSSFPPVEWTVDGLVPTGAILLSGLFKIGKSWLMLQLADCVSRGKPFLGREVSQGTVLYLALEDGPARIQSRAAKMGIVLSENVFVANSWLAGAEGLTALDAWLDATPARLVIIDTLSRWQDDYPGNDIWARDTHRIADLKAIADRHNATVLVVHHRSKAAREDIHQSIAGTNALQGAADGSLILDRKRMENMGKLSATGRDIPEEEIAVEFVPETCSWKASDIDPTELALSNERRAILDTIRGLGGSAKPGQIAERLKKDRSSVSHVLLKLVADGVVATTGYGTYTTVTPVHTEHTVHASHDNEAGTVNTVNTVNGIGDAGTSHASYGSCTHLQEKAAEPVGRTSSSFANFPAVPPPRAEPDELGIF